MDDDTNKDTATSSSIEKKLAEAKMAMEGLDRTEKRLEEERNKVAEKEIGELNTKLSEVEKNKETLELEWVKLDDKRQVIRQALKPILDAEKMAEDEEATLEIEEAKAALPEQKMAVEKKRWDIQEKRRKAEKEKWDFQTTLWELEKTIEINTKKYRTLLEDEDKLKTRLQELKSTIIT